MPGARHRRSRFKTSDYVGMLNELRSRASRLPHLRTIIRIGGEGDGMLAFDDMPDRAEPAPAAPCQRSSERNCSSTIRSTSSSPAAPPAIPRAPRSPITISSTTASSSVRRCGLTMRISSAFRCRSIIASAWCWAISPASPMARPWSIRARVSIRSRVADSRGRALQRPLWRADHVHRRARPRGVPQVRPLNRCAPASWRARPARSR